MSFWKSETPAYVDARFAPKPDITILELAQIVNGIAAHMGPVKFREDSWAALPHEIKRHFWPVGGVS